MFKRFIDPHFTPYELWQSLTAAGQALHGAGYLEYPVYLKEILPRLHKGSVAATERASVEHYNAVSGFDKLVLCGGKALDNYLLWVLRDMDIPVDVVFPEDPRYSGVQGARWVADKESYRKPVLVDWGQTSVKYEYEGKREMLTRDTSQFPKCLTSDSMQDARKLLRAFYQDFMKPFLAHTDGVVLSLPVEIDVNGFAKSSSYYGLEQDLKELFSLEDYGVPVAVVNDAECAGFGVRELCLGKTLILTLGHSIGAVLFRESL